MALTLCPECAKEVSTEAVSCPHCGHPLTVLAELDELDDDESWLEEYVGRNWFSHYSDRLMRFHHTEGSRVSWNWAAFFVPGWLLYRKLYGWWFALLALSFVLLTIQVASLMAGMNEVTLMAGLGAWAIPFVTGMFGDYFVYRRGRRVIENARATVAEPDRARRAVAGRGGTNIAALLIVLVLPIGIGMLAAISIPKFANTKVKAYQAAMKSDLRNLAMAQESNFADWNTYFAGDACTAVSWFDCSSGVSITVNTADGDGWGATATHNGAPGVTCAMYYGRTHVTAPAIRDSEPFCQ